MAMKKSLIIIASVAILGIIAIYAVPLTSKKTTASTSSTLTPTTTSSLASDAAASQTSATSTASTTASTTTSTSSSLKDGTYTGDASSTPFGDVQVKLTISNGKISAVTAVAYPSEDRHSLQLSQAAIPELTQEAIAAQSANISTISGASYTSESYIQSLQTALEQAKA